MASIAQHPMLVRAVAYTRVSSEDQAKGQSLEVQIEQIKQLCAVKGWAFIREYSDPGLTATNAQRPGLQRMLADAKRGSFNLVLVVNIDRLSRDLADMWPIIKEFRQSNVGVAATSIPDVTSLSKDFYLVYGGMAGMTQYFKENLKEITGKGIASARKKGMHLGRAPNGFVIDDAGYLQPDALGKKALDAVELAPEMKLRDLAEMLGFEDAEGKPDTNKAHKIRQACLKYREQIDFRMRLARRNATQSPV